jgi:hypothetical protein
MVHTAMQVCLLASRTCSTIECTQASSMILELMPCVVPVLMFLYAPPYTVLQLLLWCYKQLVRQKYVAGLYHLVLLRLKLLVLYTVTLSVASSKQRSVTEHSDTLCYNSTNDIRCICYKRIEFNEYDIAEQQFRILA